MPSRSVARLLAGLLVCLAVALTGCAPTGAPAGPGTGAAPGASTPSRARTLPTVPAARLPAEARRTLALIDRGGPYPYAKDGAVFGNIEHRLPPQSRGYYHEFTVPTPGSHDRGARRIVTGGGHEIYYTDDHYNSFRAVLR
ncbi:ribonuclease domain-containing protein [Streptomyces tropicalis]|uniref:Ribonuclease domain-containing protein n=1 Tax=Streptomyces tropicalis TaxID=3034234 RepID=A0ABT6ACM7_9ACTN|nr:ribonuclease domain-containing protein [Streptomyces tropicalis]MDF3302397.1 ribonuclease domain-containing protein [Streptomyces tropicalis]